MIRTRRLGRRFQGKGHDVGQSIRLSMVEREVSHWNDRGSEHLNEVGDGLPPRSEGQRPVRTRFLSAVGVSVALFALCLMGVGDAWAAPQASQPPVIRSEPVQIAIHSTRALVEVSMETFDLSAHWEAGYSEEPKPSKWEAAGEGNIPPTFGNTEVSVGEEDGTNPGGVGARCRELHHLSPKKTYYVRFFIEDEAGHDEEVIEFKTPSISAPEIPDLCNNPGVSTFRGTSGTRDTHKFTAQVETNGTSAEYHFEYTTTPLVATSWKEMQVGASGTVTAAENFANPEAEMTGLAPETEYNARIRTCAEKAKCAGSETTKCELPGCIERKTTFVTPTDRPVAERTQFRNVTASSAKLFAQLDPSGSATTWRFEVTTTPNEANSWKVVAGAEGSISQSQAEGLPEGADVYAEGSLSGLNVATEYCVRLFAENAAGEGLNFFGEPIALESKAIECFKTEGPPTVSTFAVHGLHEEAVRLLGEVDPNSTPTDEEQTITIGGSPASGTFTLTFEGQTTAPIAFNAPAEGPGSVDQALSQISSKPQIQVHGLPGGPYNVIFIEHGNVPEIAANSDDLSVSVVVSQEGGESDETHYYFEYVTMARYEESGFAVSEKTAEIEVPATSTRQFVGSDVPVLKEGESYRYRIVAKTTFPGSDLVVGEAQGLTAPPHGLESGVEPCPNASLRSGPSQNLPDCRAYEQVTPVDKEGAQEPFNYGPTVVSGALEAEDGNRVILHDPAVSYGSGPSAGGSPYVFKRQGSGIWSMLSVTPQPQTGAERVVPELFSDDLTSIALEVDVHTSVGAGESKEVKFETGPVGGPYELVATVPRKDLESKVGLDEGWIAASDNFSTLILQVEDRNLVEPATTTKTGNDLYEYSDHHLAQVNVGIGSCGAHMVSGNEEGGLHSSTHAVSEDGSRVFFEAVPGSNCSAPSHLYMRKGGVETFDIGQYKFGGANPEGTLVLLESEVGGSAEFSIYDTENQSMKKIFSVPKTTDAEVGTIVPREFGSIYFHRPTGDLYRYDVDGEKLSYLFNYQGDSGRASADGNLYYFAGVTPGVPGEEQVFLYNAAESSVECVSCASPYDPEPKLPAIFPHHPFGDLGSLLQEDGHPRRTFLSSDGKYAFFDTPSALVPSDGDGEVAPTPEAGAEMQSGEFSSSSDVYEWRRDGVNGCAKMDGCLALITNGRGGFLNLLLGATPSGSDVFVYTRSELVAQDNDNAGDIYDVRINGGEPAPSPPPVECENVTCVDSPLPPIDATPSSFTFSGPENVVPSSKLPKKTVKKKAAKKHKKSKQKKKRKSKFRTNKRKSSFKSRRSSVSSREH